MLCAVKTLNLTTAREIYSQMSTSNKMEPSTQFIIYEVALLSRESDLGKQHALMFRIEGA